MQDDDTLALLNRLTTYAEQTELSIAKVTADVERLRDERYKPYLTTMGAFLAIFVAAVGYVYAMEQRLMASLFQTQGQIQNVLALEKINENSIDVLEKRLAARTNTMGQRWDQHKVVHEKIDRSQDIVGKEVLGLIKEFQADRKKK